MEEYFTKYLIIGAGLSGLTTAFQLHKSGHSDFRVLESRDRIGGRILTKDGIDFGATWFQNYHRNVLNLLDEIGLQKFHQYNSGRNVLVYSSMAPEHYFESDKEAPSAFRITGGTHALIEGLVANIKGLIDLDTNVQEIIEVENTLHVLTKNKKYVAEKVIMTIPPLIATRINFSPILPENVMSAMGTTHTWMSNAMKIGMTFNQPFWREKDLSGTIIGQVGPVVELYDHTDAHERHYALMGFLNETLRDVDSKSRKERVLEYLSKYFGKEIYDHLTYEEKDWTEDLHTSCDTVKSIYMSPDYGNPVFEKPYMSGKLIISGAETSTVYGGYMEGAVFSGKEAARKATVIKS